MDGMVQPRRGHCWQIGCWWVSIGEDCHDALGGWNLAPLRGIEPLQAGRQPTALPLSYSSGIFGGVGADSNPQPLNYEDSALPLSYDAKP